MSKIKYEDIIDYLKNNRVSQQQWEEMVDVANEHDRALNAQEAKDLEIAYMKKLEELYKTDKDFASWCNWLKEICDYNDYELRAISKYPKAIKDEYADTPEEDYYLPCFTPTGMLDEGNPYVYITYKTCIVYIRSDWDEYITGNEHGEKAFTAFWVSHFDTCALPEFIVSDEYKDGIYDSLRGTTCGYRSYYKRSLTFDLTIWDRDTLIDEYKKAIAE